MQLRPYQTNLIESARAEFANGHKRVLMVAPCGSGKTVLASFMCGEHVTRGGKVLFLAHRRELLEQAAGTFERAGVANITGRNGARINMDRPITVMSVQTAARRLAMLEAPTMIIADECHHCMAKTWQTVLNAYPGAFVVGLTATPVRLDGKGLGDTFEAMVEGVSAEWLIDNHYLAPYKYFSVPSIDTSSLKKKRGEYQAADIEELFKGSEARISGDVVAHYKRLADGKQAICYCPSIRLSKYYAEKFREADIAAEHMDGDMNAPDREAVVERFRSGRTKIICNVDLLGEGFDVPDCACCIMLRPTASLGLYIQQSMRCMRYREGKIAIIIDHVSNYKRHGAPDENREWTLQGRKKIFRVSDVSPTRTCPNCFAELPAAIKVCPECGYQFEDSMGELEISEDTEVKLDEIDFAARRKQRKLEEAMARSYEDFVRIGRERGYKPGWSYFRAKERGYI